MCVTVMKTLSAHHARKFNMTRRRKESALRNVLNKMVASQDVGSIAEGERYICPTCNIPLKLCIGNPDALCRLKVTENTELSLLFNATGVGTAVYGRCLQCGKRLSPHRMKSNPLQELCVSCEAHKVKRKIHTRKINP